MSGSDSKYFQTTKRGEMHDLKEELNMPNKEKQKDAVKKVIAAMTVGKDVSVLFTDVIKCMQTPNIELKKLVYLYLINYAKSQPELAILAVNTFVRDASDLNPLIRALAVRTMGCIRVDRISEYLCDPLRKALKDDDPYVRKTAATCVAKLYDINGELVEDQGFIDALNDLLSDSNPMVVANAVAALTEIAESNPSKNYFELTSSTLHKLLTALNECTEWGQVFILDSLSGYVPIDSREAENIVERVSPRLQHANGAVVLSAVKVIMIYMDHIRNPDAVRALCRKLAPPLVTLTLGADAPEIQYVALRNINLIVQKRPHTLNSEFKVFFCKYNDPVYVKLEKLEIMVRLASERNIDAILLEFKEYATEIDVEFVRKAVRAIGRVAIKLDRSAERCVNVLLELIQTKVNYVVQESIIVIKDIFRKYPNRYESIIATLCEALDILDDSEARASMIWIIGEYCGRIDNADELLDSFMVEFQDESLDVQLQLLTATVKLFLHKPDEAQDTVKRVLNQCTQDCDNPDLRDRGFVYWRLLSIDVAAAKAVVLSEKPPISDDTNSLESSLLDELIANIANIASVYHKPPSQFVTAVQHAPLADVEDGDYDRPEEREERRDDRDERRDDRDDDRRDDRDDDRGRDDSGGDADVFGASAADDAPKAPLPVVLTAEKGNGMVVKAGVTRSRGDVVLEIEVDNQSAAELGNFQLQFNKNTFGLEPTSPSPGIAMLAPGASGRGSVALRVNPAFVPPAGKQLGDSLQVAIKNSSGKVSYFAFSVGLGAVCVEDGKVEKQDFLQTWKSIPDSTEKVGKFNELNARCNDISAVETYLAANNIFTIAKRNPNNTSILYLSFKDTLGRTVLLELTFPGTGGTMCKLAVRSKAAEGVCAVAMAAFASLLKAD